MAALEECLHDRVGEQAQRHHRRDRDKEHQAQPEVHVARNRTPVIAREMLREQREDYRRNRRGEDLLRKVHQLGCVIHAGHRTRR